MSPLREAGAGRAPAAAGRVQELRVEVEPPWPFRLGGGTADGLLRRRGHSVQRLLHIAGERVHVGIVQPAPDRVLFAARSRSELAAMEGIRRMRFATGVDDDLRPFYDAFKNDPLIGKAVRSHPKLRVRRRPVAWEALSAAIFEQLIEFGDAVRMQRRMIYAHGSRCPVTQLRDGPAPAAVAALAPAEIMRFGLAPRRAIALRRAAIEVAAGRADLERGPAEVSARRLLKIPDIGPWTVEQLALHGQGRYDVIAAGDLGYIKIVGTLLTGHPKARAEIPQVRELFAPYGEWKGLAGEYVRSGWMKGLIPIPAPRRRDPALRREGTRSSAPAPRTAAA